VTASDAVAAVLCQALTCPASLSRDCVHVLESDVDEWVGALAAILYARPDLVDDALVDRLTDWLETRGLPPEVFAYLASSPVAASAWAGLVGVLTGARVDEGTRARLVPLVQHFVQWRADLVGLDGILALAEAPALARHREFLLDHGVERFVFETPEAFERPHMERMAALFGDSPRFRYALASLAERRRLAPGVAAWLASRLAAEFPFRARAASVLTARPFRMLVVSNVRFGQGDETVRLAPLLQACLDANPELTVALITRRGYLYDHPRVTTISIDDRTDVQRVLGASFDGVVNVFEPRLPELAFDPGLHDAVERLLAARPPGFVIGADHARGHFLFYTVAVSGDDIARSRDLDRRGLRNIYEPTLRLLAELGLPQRAAEESPLTESVLAGVPSFDAERVWAELVGPGAIDAARPVALLNPFGGARPEKGFLPVHDGLLAAEIRALVADGWRVLLLPNGTAWGGGDAAERVVRSLDAESRAHVRIAPDPAEAGTAERLGLTERPALPAADRVMRLFKYFAAYADLVITVEGWMTHLAYVLGRPFRLFLAAQSYGFDWHPHGRGRDQRLVTTLAPRSTAGYAASGLLGAADPPPLPDRSRKALLMLALDGLGPDATELLRRALRSPDPDVRAAAVVALGRLRPLDDLKADLIAALDDRQPAVACAAAEALLAAGIDCRQELGAHDRDHLLTYVDIAKQRWSAVQGRGVIALPALLRATESHDAVIGREARWVLSRTLLAHVPGLSRDRMGKGA
jgi:hypothetical protein